MSTQSKRKEGGRRGGERKSEAHRVRRKEGGSAVVIERSRTPLLRGERRREERREGEREREREREQEREREKEGG